MKLAAAAVTIALASLGTAHAATLNLGLNGANVFTLGNFTSSGSDTEGSIIARGNVTLSSYSVNQNDKDALGHYSLIVGGNLSLTSGSINHGDTYAGLSSTITSAGVYSTPQVGGTAPLNLNTLAAYEAERSAALAAVTPTTNASAVVQYSGLVVTGTASSGNRVEVIDITAAQLSSINNFTFNNLITSTMASRATSDSSTYSTIIFNVSGTTATLSGGYTDLANYNVLFNFYQATTLTLNGVGLEASVLAPLATVTNGGGHITGDVIVKDWNSGIQINSGNAFQSVNVTGLTVSAVPEADTYAMLLTGLGLLGFIGRRRKAAAR
ncbi:choice-of-anchor A family protein [Duganella sp. FT80W]|uniref:Choice-of-anchor A family protein n=2 Tax=Duganella guangzhouensis TaxID=2666084 RepID=A0A6I2L122_9BURK|nr:choice-of-anchor A family protein [Duganella guangzhouensis]